MFGLFGKDKATDPVCHMKVDKNKTSYSSEYQGTKYFFCSQNCKNQFDLSPKDYVAENTAGGCCH